VGHVITTTGSNGGERQTIRYVTERVVGNGSFGVVYMARCMETSETVRCLCNCVIAGFDLLLSACLELSRSPYRVSVFVKTCRSP
jgi:hypothetical protein